MQVLCRQLRAYAVRAELLLLLLLKEVWMDQEDPRELRSTKFCVQSGPAKRYR